MGKFTQLSEQGAYHLPMIAFIGSWVLAYLLGGGLVLGVLLYVLFFSKNPLVLRLYRFVITNGKRVTHTLAYSA